MEQLQHQIRAKDIIRKNIENYNNKGFYLTGNQWLDVAKATGDGMISGAESIIDGATNGFYKYTDAMSDNSADDRYNRLRNEAYQAGIGGLYDTVQYTNNLIGDYGTKLKILSYLKFK
ncbi:MAG: hypothetical protein E7016_03990 [Alphaproteobacteria bacterium]|nr:hypothetical protein [Alphaproteobacteria bacterium]